MATATPKRFSSGSCKPQRLTIRAPGRNSRVCVHDKLFCISAHAQATVAVHTDAVAADALAGMSQS